MEFLAYIKKQLQVPNNFYTVERQIQNTLHLVILKHDILCILEVPNPGWRDIWTPQNALSTTLSNDTKLFIFLFTKVIQSYSIYQQIMMAQILKSLDAELFMAQLVHSMFYSHTLAYSYTTGAQFRTS